MLFEGASYAACHLPSFLAFSTSKSPEGCIFPSVISRAIYSVFILDQFPFGLRRLNLWIYESLSYDFLIPSIHNTVRHQEIVTNQRFVFWKLFYTFLPKVLLLLYNFAQTIILIVQMFQKVRAVHLDLLSFCTNNHTQAL